MPDPSAFWRFLLYRCRIFHDKACSRRFQENGCRRCCIWGAETGWHIKHGTDERTDGGGRGYVGDPSQSFDVCVDPIETMEQAISLGINTILTSGQRNVCLQGADLLRELEERVVDVSQSRQEAVSAHR